MKRKNIVIVVLVLLVMLGIGIALVKWQEARREAARVAALDAQGAAAALVAAPPASRSSKKQWQDPEAREALTLVGKDAAAEQYWILAINNPNLPAGERSDLIEDLNEEGYVNRKKPTPEDLKVIEYRLKLIEQLLPLAMDKVNADAFKEAHKDLTQMLNQAPR